MTYIQNCLNYGTITYNGTSNFPVIGGVLGYTASGTNNIESCVSGGRIVSNEERNKGSIFGSIYSNSDANVNITHSYWTSDVNCTKVCDQGSPSTDSETSQVSLNTSTVDTLNSYNTSWNKWLLNTNNKSVTFKVNSGKGFSFSSQLILLPDFTGDGESHNFSGWFEDNNYTSKAHKHLC